MVFLRVEYDGGKKLVKFIEFEVNSLKKAIEEKFCVKNITFATADNLQITDEHIIEYISQYIYTDSSFAIKVHGYVTPTVDFTPGAKSALNLFSKEVLESFVKNTNLLLYQSFMKNKKFNNFERVQLSKLIIDHLLSTSSSKRISTTDLENLSVAISQVFVGELASTYYTPFSKGIHARGKLHDAYNNLRNKLAIAGVISRGKKRVSKEKSPDSDVKVEYDSSIDSPENTLLYLEDQNNKESSLVAWRNTFDHRQNILSTGISAFEYIKRFPNLEEPNGYKLLFLDFQLKYKKEIELLIPDDLRNALIEKVHKSRSEIIPNILNVIENETCERRKSIVSFMLLPFLFPNPVKRNSRGECIKSTKDESALFFIVHFPDIVSANTGVQEIFERFELSTEQLQPFLVFIGVPVETTWLFVAHVRYPFTCMEEGVKAALAAYVCLNIRYPKFCEGAWFILQKYLFEVSTPYDAPIEVKASTIAHDLGLV